jgi:hypothetical protein
VQIGRFIRKIFQKMLEIGKGLLARCNIALLKRSKIVLSVF